jgi:hypothetical protein
MGPGGVASSRPWSHARHLASRKSGSDGERKVRQPRDLALVTGADNKCTGGLPRVESPATGARFPVPTEESWRMHDPEFSPARPRSLLHATRIRPGRPSPARWVTKQPPPRQALKAPLAVMPWGPYRWIRPSAQNSPRTYPAPTPTGTVGALPEDAPYAPSPDPTPSRPHPDPRHQAPSSRAPRAPPGQAQGTSRQRGWAFNLAQGSSPLNHA